MSVTVTCGRSVTVTTFRRNSRSKVRHHLNGAALVADGSLPGSACQTAAVAYLDGQPPRAFAHRGWHTGDLTGRENTLAAFRRAFEEGYRYLETDAHATADGALIAFHDPFLDRVTDAKGRVATMRWDQVRRARIHGTDPIPLMSELLDALPEARFNIDAKSAGVLGPLADLIRTAGVADRVCLGSFSDRRLATLRQMLGPQVDTSMGPRDIFRLVRATARGRGFATSAVAAQVPVSWQRFPIVTPRFIAAAHAADLEVHVWTINEEPEMHRLLDLGVDAIMTDRPDLLRDVLVGRGAWR